MIIYLRDENNDNVLDVEIYKTEGHVELHSSVSIIPYSKILLEQSDKFGDPDESAVFDPVSATAVFFDQLSELRGWLWEGYFMGRQNTDEEYEEVLEALREMLKMAANQYELKYVED